MSENFIKNNILELNNFKEITNKIEFSGKVSEDISFLIQTINDLLSVINLRINLTDEEKEYIQTIKTNIAGINKIL